MQSAVRFRFRENRALIQDINLQMVVLHVLNTEHHNVSTKQQQAEGNFKVYNGCFNVCLWCSYLV